MGKGIRKSYFSFEDSTLTHFVAAMTLFQRFCRKLGPQRDIAKDIPCWQRASAVYHPVELLQSMIIRWWRDMGLFIDTRIIQYNGCFQELLVWKEFPKPSDLERIL